MAVNYGPGVIKNGLVMHFDMANRQKSWLGAPATNLIPYSQDFSNAAWNGNLFGNWINSGVTTDTMIAPDNTLTADTITGNYGKFTASITASVSTAYTFSCWVKNVSLVNPLYFHVAFGLNGTLVNYNNIISIPVSSIGTWSRYSITVTSPASGINQIQCGIEFGASKTSGGTFAVAAWGAQLEVGSYATPYILTTTAAASRSTTQAIVDLTGNNAITATSLTYNSGGTFSFNGSSNYLDITGNADNRLQNGAQTISMWVKINSIGPNGEAMIYNVSGGAAQTWICWTPGGVNFYCGSNVTSVSISSANSYSQWMYVTYIIDRVASTFTLYKNGAYVNSVGFTRYTPSATTVQIGNNSRTGNGGDYTNGSISNIQLYNRVLTAGEVVQNFNALRGGYGI